MSPFRHALGLLELERSMQICEALRSSGEQVDDARQADGLVASQRPMEQRLLRSERVVDARRVQTGGSFDIGHRRGLVAPLTEHLDHAIQDLVEVELAWSSRCSGFRLPGCAMTASLATQELVLKGSIQNIDDFGAITSDHVYGSGPIASKPAQEARMSTPPPPSTESVPDPRRWLVLAVMSIGTLIVFLDGTVINTALPNISTKLSATTSQLQWVVDSYILVLAGLLLLGGTMGDRFGRRRWMSIGLLFFGAGSVLGGLSNTIETLIAAQSGAGPRRCSRAAQRRCRSSPTSSSARNGRRRSRSGPPSAVSVSGSALLSAAISSSIGTTAPRSGSICRS